MGSDSSVGRMHELGGERSAALPATPPSGHVFRVDRMRGTVWYAKYRLPYGRQVQRKRGRLGSQNRRTLGRLRALAAPAPRAACSRAYQIFQLLLAEEAPHTVRAWFLGLKPQLDDESPAESICKGAFREVLVAAKAFLHGG